MSAVCTTCVWYRLETFEEYAYRIYRHVCYRECGSPVVRLVATEKGAACPGCCDHFEEVR